MAHPDRTLPEPYVIAEIGCNHRGDVTTAAQMIGVAAQAGARSAKFQKRHPKECLTPDAYAAPYNSVHSYGETYGEHREALELSIEDHAYLQTVAEKEGVTYSASVWDVTSAREVIGLQPPFIKVPSACNTHDELMRVLREEYPGEVHVSVGMSTQAEIDAIVASFAASPERLVLYSCTSGYPVPPEDVALGEITRLGDLYAGQVREVGFSGHHNGIAIDVAAYVLGARVIERHFTLDRTWKGTDHAASLEPGGLGKLVRDLSAVRDAMGVKVEEILPIEAVQRAKLKDQASI